MTGAVLVWLNRRAPGRSFCDYSGSQDIVTLEQTAINAFIAMELSLANAPTEKCKVAMHQWMCWQVRLADAL